MLYSNTQSYISIISLYNYDNKLFDNMSMPAGIDTDLLKNLILQECGNLETFYPNFEFFKASIGWWSSKNYDVFKKLYDTTTLEYNPIWNKDGVITETRAIDESNTTDAKRTGTTEGESTSNTNTTTRVAAFNSSDFENNDTAEGNGNTASRGAETNNEQSSGTRKYSEMYERKEQGNIGITTTQQMIKEERDISEFNIYDFIVNSFKNSFCVLIY